MNILLTQSGSKWLADMTDLPGSPPIGTGATKEEAVVSLFFRLIHSLSYKNLNDFKVLVDFEITVLENQ